MKFSLVLLATGLVTARGIAASVEGTVKLVGRPPSEVPIQMPPECAKLQEQPPTTRHHVVSNDGGLANVFITIRSGLEGKHFTPPTNVVVMSCIACQVQPYVVAVQAGQPLRIENSSPIQENCHFTTRQNRERNFAMPSGSTHLVTFDQPEDFIRFKGDVYPWFFGYVCVVNHPFFAVTRPGGHFQLPDGLPDGEYTLEARHLKAGPAQAQITVRNGRAAPVNFVLRVQAPVRPPASKLSL